MVSLIPFVLHAFFSNRVILIYPLGYHVCSGAAAAASGAVFGCIIWALRLPYTIIMGYRPPEGVIREVIGKWRQSPQQEEVVVESEKVESTKV